MNTKRSSLGHQNSKVTELQRFRPACCCNWVQGCHDQMLEMKKNMRQLYRAVRFHCFIINAQLQIKYIH